MKFQKTNLALFVFIVLSMLHIEYVASNFYANDMKLIPLVGQAETIEVDDIEPLRTKVVETQIAVAPKTEKVVEQELPEQQEIVDQIKIKPEDLKTQIAKVDHSKEKLKHIDEIDTADMIFYDYKDEDSSAVQGIDSISDTVNTTLSSNVAQAIQRAKMQVANSHPVKKVKRSTTPSEVDILNLFDEIRRQEQEKSARAKISLVDFNVNSKADSNLISGFEVREAYGFNNIINDDNTGEVLIQRKLSESMGVINSSILKTGYLPVTLDIGLIKDQTRFYQIPMFSIASFNEFLESKNLYGQGGNVLVKVPDLVEKVSIDANYERKLFINSSFNEVDIDDDYVYVLFLGVDPGNVLLSYTLADLSIVDKVALVEEDSVYYDDNYLVRKTNYTFELYNEFILSKKSNPLDLEPEKIFKFNSEVNAQRDGVTRYKMNMGILSTSMRAYIEFDYLETGVFVGTWDSENITLPGEEYFQQILNDFGISNLNGRCLIQLNLAKKPMEVEINGLANHNGIFTKNLYLSRNGSYSDEVNPLTQKVFTMGDRQGIYNMKVSYVDGSEDYLMSFCSLGTYLVEQL